MIINNLKIFNFKNFIEKEFIFESGINLITAPNGKGKTNTLDAIRTMCYGRPLFTPKESDSINFISSNSEYPYIKIIMKWDSDSSHISSYTLSPNIKPIKSLVYDNVKKIQRNFVGLFSVVWFSPETINIITSAPKQRREVLDAYFSQLSIDYLLSLQTYNKALDARNRFLKTNDKSTIYRFLSKYDEVLAREGEILLKIKLVLIKQLINEVSLSSIQQNRYKVDFLYVPNIGISQVFDENIKAQILYQLEQSRHKDVLSKRTNTGPHRDDWTLLLTSSENTYDLRMLGSRGQKRMGLLIFTLAIVSLLKQEKGSNPVLLLDDVVSELDDENVSLILNMLHKPNQQSIITSTHKNILGLDSVNIIELK